MSWDGIVGGLIGGILSPIVLGLLQHNLIWKNQKLIEAKKAAFDDAVRALAMREVDALDNELQANPPQGLGVQPQTVLRTETKIQMQKARSLVGALFSVPATAAFDNALRAKLAVNNIPNDDFEEKRATAVRTMAEELELLRNWASFG